jgi:hypothetical protein
MSWPKLTVEERRAFFCISPDNLEEWARNKQDYVKKPLPIFCVENISWMSWVDLCDKYEALSYLRGFPEMCYDTNLTPGQEGQLLDFLDYLLTEKTTKTFEDLL